MKLHRRYFAAAYCFIMLAMVGQAWSQPGQVRFKVWSNQDFDEPYWNDDPIELYFRLEERGYLTVFAIDPWGRPEIVYPQSHHTWKRLRAHRTYCLSDLAEELRLCYRGADGDGYIGAIVTSEPVHLAPWLEDTFCDEGLIFRDCYGSSLSVNFGVVIPRIEASIRLRLGARCEPTFYTTRIRVRPRSRTVIIRQPPYCPPPPPRYPTVIVVPEHPRPSYPVPSHPHDPEPEPRWKKRPADGGRRGHQPPEAGRPSEPRKEAPPPPRESKPKTETRRVKTEERMKTVESTGTVESAPAKAPAPAAKPQKAARREKKSRD